MSRSKLNIIQSMLEYIFATVFILGGISMFFADPITAGTFIANLLGSQAAAITYGVWFNILGGLLLYSKITKRRRLHKNMLLAMYLSCIFTFFIEVAILGWVWYLLDEVFMGVCTGFFWLRWKFRTEYYPTDPELTELPS